MVDKIENKLKIILIVFTAIQLFVLFFVLVGLLASIGHGYDEGYIVVFDKEDLNTEPYTVCLNARDVAAQSPYPRMMIEVCDDSGMFKVKDVEGNYNEYIYFHAPIKYENETGIITANLSGKTFEATPKNNYTLIIPLEFEDLGKGEPEEVVLKIKTHIEYIESLNYLFWMIILFSPTIILLIYLVIKKFWKKRNKK